MNQVSKIEILKIKDLKEYDHNTRQHQDKDIAEITKSIKRFGFCDPIGIWSDQNIIVEGHGRLEAAKNLGLEEVPVIRLDHLTDEERRAYGIAHNRTAELSEWNFEELEKELKEIDISEFDFNFEFATEESGEPAADEEEEDTRETDLMEAAAAAEEKIKQGDMYILGDHVLMCGDSTSEEQIKDLLGDAKVKLFLSDPPYGVDIVQKKSVGADAPAKFENVCGGKVVKVNKYRPVKGDETTETAKKNYEIIQQYTENQIIFGGNYFTDFLKPSACWIVWDKKNSGNFADVELAWSSFDKAAKLYEWLWNGMSRAGDRKTEGKKRIHPTQKPVGLLENIIKDFTNENDTVLDCFGGSGSTLLACEKTKRKCFMIEYEPYYVNLIIERWEQFTGLKAKKVEGVE